MKFQALKGIKSQLYSPTRLVTKPEFSIAKAYLLNVEKNNLNSPLSSGRKIWDRPALQNKSESIFPVVLISTSYTSSTQFKLVHQEVLKIYFHQRTLHFHISNYSWQWMLAMKRQCWPVGTKQWYPVCHQHGWYILNTSGINILPTNPLSQECSLPNPQLEGVQGGAGVGTNRNMVVSQRNAELSLETYPTLLPTNGRMGGSPLPQSSQRLSVATQNRNRNYERLVSAKIFINRRIHSSR